jgi:cytoskeletal protein CcmA (bactofilin family)
MERRMRNEDTSDERLRSGLSADSRAPLNERRLAAWIGRSVRVEGKVISDEDLTIDGHVEGSIELGNHSLTIGPDATIRADLVAKVVTISGAVTGSVRATEQLNVRETGSVAGDIIAPRFVMAEGAIITGRVDVGGRPRASAAE